MPQNTPHAFYLTNEEYPGDACQRVEILTWTWTANRSGAVVLVLTRPDPWEGTRAEQLEPGVVTWVRLGQLFVDDGDGMVLGLGFEVGGDGKVLAEGLIAGAAAEVRRPAFEATFPADAPCNCPDTEQACDRSDTKAAQR